MSYIERATYDYIKKILSEGTRVLFSRRFILFTLLLISSGILSVVALNLDVNRETTEIILLLQAAISIAFIIAGLFAKRLLSTLKRFFLLLIIIVVVGLLGILSSSQFLNLNPIRIFFLEIYPILSFIGWTIIMPIAAFGFARGMFYSKVTGSILFLGKPENDHNAIFAFFLAIIAVIGVLAGVAIVTTNTNEPIFQVYGLIAIGLSILVIFIVFGKIFRNDALNSAIGLFFVITTLPAMILLLISSSGDPGVGLFNYALIIFSLIYTAQAQAKRASKHAGMTEEDIRIDLAREKLEAEKQRDPYGISRGVQFLGSEGLVLMFLGIFLGFILLQLEYIHFNQEIQASSGTGFNQLLSSLWVTLSVGQMYQIFSIIVVTFIFFTILITYYFYPPANRYHKPDLIRLSFLPNYDEIKAYITAVQSGEITKKDMTADALKLMGGQLVKQAREKGRGLLGRLGFGSNKDK